MIQAVDNQFVKANTKTQKKDKDAGQNSFLDLLQNTAGTSGTAKIKTVKNEKRAAEAVINSGDSRNTSEQEPQKTVTEGIPFIIQPFILTETSGNIVVQSNAENVQTQNNISSPMLAQITAPLKTGMSVQQANRIAEASVIPTTSEDAAASVLPLKELEQTAVQMQAGVSDKAEQNSYAGSLFDIQIKNTVSAQDSKIPLSEFNCKAQNKTPAPENMPVDFIKTEAGDLLPETKNDMAVKNDNGIAVLREYGENPALEWTTVKISDEANEINRPVSEQITQKIIVNLKKDTSEFNMQLYPKDLGQISVKLLAKNGTLTVELSAANTKTQELLSANADKIKEILESVQDKPVHIADTAHEQPAYSNLNDQSSQSGKERQNQGYHAFQKNNDSFETADKFLSFLEMMNLQSV